MCMGGNHTLKSTTKTLMLLQSRGKHTGSVMITFVLSPYWYILWYFRNYSSPSLIQAKHHEMVRKHVHLLMDQPRGKASVLISVTWGLEQNHLSTHSILTKLVSINLIVFFLWSSLLLAVSVPVAEMARDQSVCNSGAYNKRCLLYRSDKWQCNMNCAGRSLHMHHAVILKTHAHWLDRRTGNWFKIKWFHRSGGSKGEGRRWLCVGITGAENCSVHSWMVSALSANVFSAVQNVQMSALRLIRLFL